MKLVYIHPDPIPDKKTVPLQVLQNVHALAQAGAYITLVSPQGPLTPEHVLGYPLHENVTLHPTPNLKEKWWYWSGSSRYFYRAAAQWLQQEQPDAVFVRNLKLATYLLEQTKWPIFFEAHEAAAAFFKENHPLTWRNQRKWQKLQQREHQVYTQVKGLITMTRALEDDLREAYHFNTPVLVQPNGYHISLTTEASFPKACDKIVFLYLGSLHPWKGLNTLLEAFQWVLPEGELWIAGGDESQMRELQHQIDHLQLKSKIKLLGFIDPCQRFVLIQAVDVCVHPLTNSAMAGRHTSPLKLFEYMAMGKPIITARVPAIEEILKDQKTALLVPPQDPQQLAQAMNQLIIDPALRTRLGKETQKIAQHYTWNERAKNILRFLQNCCRHS